MGAGFPPSFTDLPDLVLGPFAGRPEADWHRTPPGKWSPAQIVEHLAIGLDTTSRRFEERRSHDPMTRRPRGLAQWMAGLCVIRLGWHPPAFRAPEGTRPTVRPDLSAIERRFREGHARFLALARVLLPGRRDDLFVKHPIIGDLTLEEWMRFHAVHCAHHAKQIRERLARAR